MTDSPSHAAQSRRLMVCNCERTMAIDGAKLATALGLPEPLKVHSHLCRSEVERYQAALETGAELLVACTQESPLFQELAEEVGRSDIRFTNIRERAGWAEPKADATAKMAALLAEAQVESRPTGHYTLKSEGVCLVYGRGAEALAVAEKLSARLSVTLLLTSWDDVIPPTVGRVPIFRGTIAAAKGHLGAFEVVVNGYAPMVASARAGLDFVMPRDGAKSACDLIFDMSGGTRLFSGPHGRDGYFAVDPAAPGAVAAAMFEISDLVGEFEKPLYVSYTKDICAHARSQKTGCTKCLEVCPTGAIAPSGDHVVVDPGLCGGCGVCSAVCPTGAVSYALPGREDLIARVQTLLATFLKAGGRDPVLLFHDASHGEPLIAAMARFGRGLPVNALPLGVYSVGQLGHDVLAASLAAGAHQIVIVARPEPAEDLPPLEREIALTEAFVAGLGLGAGRISLTTTRDPDVLEGLLHGLGKKPGLGFQAFQAVGGKREIARLALTKLAEQSPARPEMLALPAGAPYGQIVINTQGCTLCLACVSACPASALGDDPNRPTVRFTESACVQCGLCANTCPEKVITLEPRYDFTGAAMTPRVLHEEEPFHCISCGKAFGTKSTIEKVTAALSGKNWMFQNEKQLKLIQMCDTCRVLAVSEDGGDPYRSADRPRIRTTDDYIAAEAEAKKTGRTPDDFIS